MNFNVQSIVQDPCKRKPHLSGQNLKLKAGVNEHRKTTVAATNPKVKFDYGLRCKVVFTNESTSSH